MRVPSVLLRLWSSGEDASAAGAKPPRARPRAPRRAPRARAPARPSFRVPSKMALERESTARAAALAAARAAVERAAPADAPAAQMFYATVALLSDAFKSYRMFRSRVSPAGLAAARGVLVAKAASLGEAAPRELAAYMSCAPSRTGRVTVDGEALAAFSAVRVLLVAGALEPWEACRAIAGLGAATITDEGLAATVKRATVGNGEAQPLTTRMLECMAAFRGGEMKAYGVDRVVAEGVQIASKDVYELVMHELKHPTSAPVLVLLADEVVAREGADDFPVCDSRPAKQRRVRLSGRAAVVPPTCTVPPPFNVLDFTAAGCDLAIITKQFVANPSAERVLLATFSRVMSAGAATSLGRVHLRFAATVSSVSRGAGLELDGNECAMAGVRTASEDDKDGKWNGFGMYRHAGSDEQQAARVVGGAMPLAEVFDGEGKPLLPLEDANAVMCGAAVAAERWLERAHRAAPVFFGLRRATVAQHVIDASRAAGGALPAHGAAAAWQPAADGSFTKVSVTVNPSIMAHEDGCDLCGSFIFFFDYGRALRAPLEGQRLHLPGLRLCFQVPSGAAVFIRSERVMHGTSAAVGDERHATRRIGSAHVIAKPDITKNAKRAAGALAPPKGTGGRAKAERAKDTKRMRNLRDVLDALPFGGKTAKESDAKVLAVAERYGFADALPARAAA